MTTGNKKKQRTTIIVTIVLIVVGIAIGLSWYALRDWKTKVRTQVNERITKSSDGLYRLDYADVSINLLRGNAELWDVVLLSDSLRYLQLADSLKAPDNRYDVRASRIRARGIGVWSALFSKKLSIDEIVVDRPLIHIRQQTHAYNDSTKSDTTSLYNRIKDRFGSIDVGTIRVEPAQVKFTNHNEGQTKSMTVDSIQLRVSRFRLNAQTATDTARLLYSDDIGIHIPNFEYDIAGSPYKVELGDVRMSSSSRQANITQAALVPKISKSQYFQNDKENKALITLRFDSLTIEELDFQALQKRGLLYAKYAHIRDGSALFEKDKRYQADNVNKIGQAPHQQVMKLNQLLRVDTIFVRGVDIAYQEYSAKYQQTGRISFDHAHGNITNLTNDPERLKHDPLMRADLHARLMGQGALHAVFGFDMLSDAGAHSYKGTLGHMQVSEFNRIVRPLLNIEFERGNIQQIAFYMRATEYKHWGEFRFRYNDMKVNLLHKPQPGEESSTKDILSFIVNQFVVNDSNPGEDGTFRVGQIDYTRVPEYSHFKSIWQALFDGIKQSVGLGKAGELENTAQPDADEEEKKSFFERAGDFFKGLFKNEDDADTTKQSSK